MKTTTLATAAVGVLAILAGTAVAQTVSQATPAPQALRADADADGRLSRAEFVDGRIARLTVMDANRDGSVSAEEMRSGIDTRRNQQASARFDRVDTDGNGSLSREEFLSARAERGDRAGRGGQGRGGKHRGGQGARMDAAPVVIADAQTRATAAFARMDKDADGYLTPQERQSARAEMRQARQDRRAERMARRAAGTPSPSTAPSE